MGNKTRKKVPIDSDVTQHPLSTSPLHPQPPLAIDGLTPPQIETLLSYDSLKTLLTHFELANWGPEAEIQYLLEMIQQTEDPSLRLRALKELRTRRQDALKLEGLIVSASQSKKNPDGSKTIFSSQQIQNVLGGENHKKHVDSIIKESDDGKKEEETQPLVSGTEKVNDEEGADDLGPELPTFPGIASGTP